jgi:hypothetical protein
MPLREQIDSLRRQFQLGDESAREALQRLLQTYLMLVVRRAVRPQNAGSRVSGGLRRLAGQTRPAGTLDHLQLLTYADELCRRLCDELLQAPAVGGHVERVFETMRSLRRSTACFGSHA